MAQRKEPRQRILDNITIDDNGCWLIGNKLKTGYALIGVWDGKKQRHEYAHRFSWKAFNGEIQEGLEICHTCDVRNCVNPEHLFVATHQENMADKVRKGHHLSTYRYLIE